MSNFPNRDETDLKNMVARKSNNTGEVHENLGPNFQTKAYTNAMGTKQEQAHRLAKEAQKKSSKEPVRTLTKEEIEQEYPDLCLVSSKNMSEALDMNTEINISKITEDSPITQEMIGQFFIDGDKNIFEMTVYNPEPTVVFKKIGTSIEIGGTIKLGSSTFRDLKLATDPKAVGQAILKQLANQPVKK